MADTPSPSPTPSPSNKSPHGPPEVLDDDKFERLTVPNERDAVPQDFRHIAQNECYQYETKHDLPSEGLYKSCAKNYMIKENKSTVLFSMLIGYIDYGKLIEEEPFSLANKKKTILQVFHPSNSCLVDEISRRSHFLFKENPNHQDSNHPLWNARNKKARIPRPKQWSRQLCMMWLSSHAKGVFRTEDEEFLAAELERMKTIVSKAVKEEEQLVVTSEANATTTKAIPRPTWASRSGWSSLPPNLRLIEIILLPELRGLFVTRENTLGRTELDARGTDHEKVTFWEKVHEIFNKESWNFDSSILDSAWGGRFFLEKINLGWDTLRVVSVDKLDSPVAAKHKFAELSNALGGIYYKWRKSGTGDGHADDLSSSDEVTNLLGDNNNEVVNLLGDDNDEDNQSREEEAHRRMLSFDLAAKGGGDRYHFLGDANPACMYLWHHLEQLNLMESALADLSTPFAADDNGVPNARSCSARSGKNKKNKGNAGSMGASERLALILGDYSKKHDDTMHEFVLQQKLATTYQSQLQVLLEKKKTYENFLCKQQENADRARERADDEECNGNIERMKKWKERARHYEERVSYFNGRMKSVELQANSVIQAQADDLFGVPTMPDEANVEAYGAEEESANADQNKKRRVDENPPGYDSGVSSKTSGDDDYGDALEIQDDNSSSI